MLAPGLKSAPLGAELQASDDLSRHQEALDVVSTFAAQLHEHMETCIDGQAVTHDSQVAQACCEVAGVHDIQHCSITSLLVCSCVPCCLRPLLDSLHLNAYKGNASGVMSNILSRIGCDQFCLLCQAVTVQSR